jgi:hypothetical protein
MLELNASNDVTAGIFSDHKALEYFMIKRQLTAQQARWAETFFRFNFKIRYRAEKKNQKTDVLTRRKQNVDEQTKATVESRIQILLKYKNLESHIIRELQLASIEKKSFDLINRILRVNRTSKIFAEYRNKISAKRD